MSGEIEYYLKVPRTKSGQIQPLIMVDKFSKETRPCCWKNCDLRVEATLPLLGNDVKAIQSSSNITSLSNTEVVKISLKIVNYVF